LEVIVTVGITLGLLVFPVFGPAVVAFVALIWRRAIQRQSYQRTPRV
jgi:hypothetical protein